MSVLLIAPGVLVLVLVFLDAFMTTLTLTSTAGPLTNRGLALIWRGLLRLHRMDRESRLLTAAGTVLLTVTVLVWVLGLWLGWALVFGGSGAVRESGGGHHAGPVDVAYFSGLTIFTLGSGDVVAASPGWRLVSAVASFSGLFLVTLAITYLISVVAAVVHRRSLAIQIRGLGEDAQGIVRNGWTGSGFSGIFEQQLIALVPVVVTSAEQHLAYPVLHYFHSPTRSLSTPLAVATLDDALLLMSEAVAEECRPDHNAVAPLRSAIWRYVETASTIGPTPRAGVPPTPGTRALKAADIPFVDEQQLGAALSREGERRALLNRLVVSDGWTWVARDA